MTNKDKRQYSMPSTATLIKRYTCGNIKRFPVGENLELVYSKEQKIAKIINREDAQLLERCNSFKTIDEHVKDRFRDFTITRNNTELILSDLMIQMLPARIASFANQLGTLVKQKNAGEIENQILEKIKLRLVELLSYGLLVSEEDLLSSFHQIESNSLDHDKIASIGILTCNRTDSLTRCITSYVENTQLYKHTPNFIVVDDSPDTNVRKNNKQSLFELSTIFKVPIFYSGFEEKLDYAERLSAKGSIPIDTIKFALFNNYGFGSSIGANRNALMLETVGEMGISVDDDTLCNVITDQDADEQCSFSETGDPAQFRFFTNRDALLDHVQIKNYDWFKAHSDFLGKPVKDCISEALENGNIRRDSAATSLSFEHLAKNNRVLLTYNGIFGDCGIDAPSGYFLLDEKSRKRFVRSEAIFNSACISREVIHLSPSTTLTKKHSGMCGAFGFDNREILPPFMPLYTNEDTIFGALIRLTMNGCVAGHLPYAVFHAPPESRSYSQSDLFKFASRRRVSDVILACLYSSGIQNVVMKSNDKIAVIGKCLMEIGNLTLDDFESFLRLELWRRQSSLALTLENVLKIHNQQPHFWAENIKKYLSVLRSSLVKEDYLVPHELLETMNLSEARKISQRLVYQYGELLTWWPQIITTSKLLRESGVRLAKRIESLK